VNADLIAGIAAVVAPMLLTAVLTAVVIALNPPRTDGAPRRAVPRDPEATVGLPAWWVQQAAAEGERRRAAAARGRDATWLGAR
jgi:hypothetical protein